MRKMQQSHWSLHIAMFNPIRINVLTASLHEVYAVR